VQERVLSLDISTKTGWAFFLSSQEKYHLEAYGQLEQIPEPTTHSYPASYVEWANLCFNEIKKIIDLYNPNVLVIEETSAGSKSAFSQKILEFIHFLLANFIKVSKIKTRYFLTEEWRRRTGCVMTKEEKKKNKEVRDFKKKSGTKVAYNKEGKRIGLTGRKHVNVRRANELFGSFFEEPLRKKQEDLCDALLLYYAYWVTNGKSRIESALSE